MPMYFLSIARRLAGMRACGLGSVDREWLGRMEWMPNMTVGYCGVYCTSIGYCRGTVSGDRPGQARRRRSLSFDDSTPFPAISH